MARVLIGACVILGLVACQGEAPPPDLPTWVDDVEPLLRGNCYQCHGVSADLANYRTVRWDVYDLRDPHYVAMGFYDPESPPDNFLGARQGDHFRLVLDYVQSADPARRMPPRPASPLDARALAVLKSWSDTGFAQGAHAPNHPPTIRWREPPLVFEVEDADRDQVLGRLDCGGTLVPVLHSGASALSPGARPPCAGTLFDGFDEAAVTLP